MSNQQSAEASRAVQKEARALISKTIQTHGRSPAFVRLALHDAMTWDAATRTGGANGSIRTPAELQHAGNGGLQAAVDDLQVMKQRVPGLSFADLVQLAGALGLEALGGPAVPFTAGRRDSRIHPPEGRLPTFGKNQESAEQFWRSFRRMGLPDKDALALLGFHPFAAGWVNPAAAEENGSLRFDNSFYRQLLDAPSKADAEALLLRDSGLRQQAQKWADNAELYVEDYAAAWQRASELGLTLSRAQASAAADTLTTAQVVVAVVAVGAIAAAGWWYGRRRRQSRGLFS